MTIHEKFVEEIIKEFVWFRPTTHILKTHIAGLVEKHQERLKPFGMGNPLPMKLAMIWPGLTPAEMFKFHSDAQKTILTMLMGNVINMVREVAVDAARISLLDQAKREVAAKVRSSAKRCAVEAAGVTAKATMAIPLMAPAPEANELTVPQTVEIASDLDMVDRSVVDATDTASRYISWKVVDDILTQKTYQNPFAPLIDLYKLGLWPVGALSKEYLVFVPGGRRTEIV